MRPERRSSDEVQAKALERAIRSGGRILGLLGGVFFTWVLASGIYWVDEGTVAVQTRFGRVLGGREVVVQPGGPYLAFPDPIDKVIHVPTSFQRISLDDSFWCSRISRPGLVPGEDGSLITGDLNIVHGRWQVVFRVSPEGDMALRFVRSIGDMDGAYSLVRSVVEQSIVSLVAKTTVDDYTRGNLDDGSIIAMSQMSLNELDCGLEIVDLSRSSPPQFPFQVMDSFMAVNEAESEKLKAIENAWRERENTLNDGAGIAYRDLVDSIDLLERERALGNPEKEEVLLRRIKDILDGDDLGGRASVMIQEARLYRTEVVEGIRGRSERFERLLPVWLSDRESLRGRLFWEVWQEILSGNVNAYYLPDGKKTIYLHLQDSLNGL
nr:SPFH domain-containing protein [uncultured Dethiosulfovibrio sp.]